MKKVYVVISSWDSYDDHYKVNECVCSYPLFAESKKTEIENMYREKAQFPFNWITEEEFNELADDGQLNLTDEDENIYNQWYDWNFKIEDFNGCLIEEIDYYDN